jgi:hypothetical protein
MHTQATPHPATTPTAQPCPNRIPWCVDHYSDPLDEVCQGRPTGSYGTLAVTYSAETGLEFGTWNLNLDLTPAAFAELAAAVDDATRAVQHTLTAVTP